MPRKTNEELKRDTHRKIKSDTTTDWEMKNDKESFLRYVYAVYN